MKHEEFTNDSFLNLQSLVKSIVEIARISLPGTDILKSGLLLVVGICLLAGCASISKDYPLTYSKAFQEGTDTEIGGHLAEIAAKHPEESGFAIIRYPRPAFTSRIQFTELPVKSLDLQYYIWEPDTTGRILDERLVRTADRGVKVRILVNDMGVSGRDDPIVSMDAHPNNEVRNFNPFAYRGSRISGFFADISRLNHRMHNKIMVMDNTSAIVGGRNIGNNYFGVDTQANFRDLDIVAGGPVVREISNVFDTFWDGNRSVPISVLVDRPFMRVFRKCLQKQVNQSNHRDT